MLIDEIISNRIKNIYRSKNVMYSFFLEGLGNLESYHYVLELDNNKKYEFYFDYICYWSGEQPLTEIETSDDIWFKNKLITDVITDNENSYFFFKLENNKVLYHNIDFGSELIVDDYDELFDCKGNLL